MGSLSSKHERSESAENVCKNSEEPRQAAECPDVAPEAVIEAAQGEDDDTFALRLGLAHGYGFESWTASPEADILSLSALPGESDSEFAHRLSLHDVFVSAQAQGSLTQPNTAPGKTPGALSTPAAPAPSHPQRTLPTIAPSVTAQAEPTDCVVCLDSAAVMGIVHGDSVHRCVCQACSRKLGERAKCPICKKTVERYLRVY